MCETGMEQTDRVTVRDAKMDNFRGILMALVVLGHLLELQAGRAGADCLYRIIYSFHKPLFVWISGYYAKKADFRCLRTLVLPYVIFQVLYWRETLYFWNAATGTLLLQPFWIMLYLLALLIWRLLLPLMYAKSTRGRAVTLGAVTVLALLAGWNQELSLALCLQRVVSLLPMFLLGYYCGDWGKTASDRWNRLGTGKRSICRAVLVLLVLAGFAAVVLRRSETVVTWLYWEYPYGYDGGTVLVRLWLIVFAVVCLAAALTLVPGRKVPFLTWLGQSTLSVYLLHGLVIKALEHWNFIGSVQHPTLWTAVLWIGMLLIFASPPVVKLFRICFQKSGKKSTRQAAA